MGIQDEESPKYFLKRINDHYKISMSSLSKISSFPEDIILKYANDDDDLSHEIKSELTQYMLLFTESMESCEEDERVQRLISGMMQEFDISVESIGMYAKISSEEVENFLEDANSLSVEKRYRLGVTVLFLHFICYTKHRREL